MENIFTINEKEITHEIIDGETIIINLLTGYYYNIEGVGTLIWKLIQYENSEEQICDFLNSKYKLEKAESIVKDFICELEEQKLIIPQNEKHKENKTINENEIKELINEKFISPKLNTYTDMKDFLLLDPIHDVEDSGWPNRKEQNNSKNKS